MLGLNLAYGGPASAPGQGPVVDASPGTPVSAVPVAPGPSPTSTTSPAPSDAVIARPALTVLNHSRRPKLAQRAAEQFAARGWPIAEVGNTRRTVLETTVFFEPGQEAAAALLRQEFPSVRAAAPRPEGLPGQGLTVVVTREFPA